MDLVSQTLMMSAAGAGGDTKTYVEDVFSTWLYTGNSSTQTITNGIDLNSKGGLVWTKTRSTTFDNTFIDTARGAGKQIYSNLTSAEQTQSASLTAFGSSGYLLGADNGSLAGGVNNNGDTYASWTFRKAAKFFDVVTYTGNGSNRTIAHNLGGVPGCIIVKRTDTTGDWQVYHRSLANTEYMVLNSTAAKVADTTRWNSTTATSTDFSLGTDATVNANGGTYVAYLFAHDAGGFGDSDNESVIKCGSFITNGTGSATVDLGWEPQWLLYKASSLAASWRLVDNMRGFDVSNSDKLLYPNVPNPEDTGAYGSPYSTGFTLTSGGTSRAYVYIAIRRGPMKAPTDATKVFKGNAYTGNGSSLSITGTGFPPDFSFTTRRDTASWVVTDKLRGAPLSLYAQATDSEVNNDIYEVTSYDQNGITYGQNSIVNGSLSSLVNFLFRRAPWFFDVVAYTGTGSTRTVAHNLGKAPELMIIKQRDAANPWRIYSSSIGASKFLALNTDAAETTSSAAWNDTVPTSAVFTVNTSTEVNGASNTYVAYLFASCPGVSKAGSYTGTGATLNIDCSFTNGARFVLIKRTDSTGGWYVWDTTRGIIAANDPYLLLNSTAAEVTNTDYIDPLSSGFQISSAAPAAINANGGSYIYLAIA